MYEYYWLFFLLIIVCVAFAGRASAKVNATFDAYKDLGTSSKMTGYDTAVRLLKNNGVNDIAVQKVSGKLTDHYHPTKKAVNLSQSTYGNDSVAAVAVAAHEVGHVLQRKTGYIPYKIRQILVPITNIGSRLALPLVLFGLILDIFVLGASESNFGFYVALVGVLAYGLSTLFALVTLPVEFNASARAKRMLLEEGIITEDELPYVEDMLGAAARTYVASLLTSLVLFLRFALWVFMLFGGRRRRN